MMHRRTQLPVFLINLIWLSVPLEEEERIIKKMKQKMFESDHHLRCYQKGLRDSLFHGQVILIKEREIQIVERPRTRSSFSLFVLYFCILRFI